jgi:hypothetical protein
MARDYGPLPSLVIMGRREPFKDPWGRNHPGAWTVEIGANMRFDLTDATALNYPKLKRKILERCNIALPYTTVEFDRHFARAIEKWHLKGRPGLVTAALQIEQVKAERDAEKNNAAPA